MKEKLNKSYKKTYSTLIDNNDIDFLIKMRK